MLTLAHQLGNILQLIGKDSTTKPNGNQQYKE